MVILELAETTLTPIEIEQAERRLKELAQEAAVKKLLRLLKEKEEADEYTDNGDQPGAGEGHEQ